jgi:hypothetical protein
MKQNLLFTPLLSLGLLLQPIPRLNAEPSAPSLICSVKPDRAIRLNPDFLANCQEEKFVKDTLCHAQFGRVYLKAPLPRNIYFIRLEDGTSFVTTSGKGEVGDRVLVITNPQNNSVSIQTFKPGYFDKLSEQDFQVKKIIAAYLEKTTNSRLTPETFCPN